MLGGVTIHRRLLLGCGLLVLSRPRSAPCPTQLPAAETLWVSRS